MATPIPLNINLIVTSLIFSVLFYALWMYGWRYYSRRSAIDLLGTLSGFCHCLGVGVSVIYFCFSDLDCYYRTKIAIPNIFMGYIFFFLMSAHRALTIYGIADEKGRISLDKTTLLRIPFTLYFGLLTTIAYFCSGWWYYSGAVAFRNAAGACTNTQDPYAITTWAVLLCISHLFITGTVIKSLWDHVVESRSARLASRTLQSIERLVLISSIGLAVSVIGTIVCYSVLIPGYAAAYGIMTGNLAVGIAQGTAIGVMLVGQSVAQNKSTIHQSSQSAASSSFALNSKAKGGRGSNFSLNIENSQTVNSPTMFTDSRNTPTQFEVSAP